MYEVQALVGKNRLVVRIWGEVGDDEAREVGDAVVKAIERLRPGFDTISDLTGLAPITAEGKAQLKRLIEIQRARGLRRVVRVVGRSVDAALQFERTSREVGHEAHLAFSMEEAERLLDGGWP